jgi:hypothetical protein
MMIKKSFCVILLVCAVCLESYSQTSGSLLEIKKSRVYQNGSVIKGQPLKSLMLGNAASAPVYESYLQNRMIGMSISTTGVGLALLGSILLLSATMNEADDVNSGNLSSDADYGTPLTLAVVGLGVVIVGIPFNVIANKKLKRSVELFNQGGNGTSLKYDNFNVVVQGNRIGISMDF